MPASSSTQKLISAIRQNDKIRILFVCLGNICRSPAAHGIMEAVVDSENASARFQVDSAGTGSYHLGDLPDKRMRIHARIRGYELTHRARQVSPADFDRFDLIIGMDADNVYNLRHLAPSPEAAARVIPMAEFFGIATRYDHVPDPYYEGAEGFELVLDLLEDACRNLYNSLK